MRLSSTCRSSPPYSMAPSHDSISMTRFITSAFPTTASPLRPLNYFNKSVHELTIAEVAYLAGGPRGGLRAQSVPRSLTAPWRDETTSSGVWRRTNSPPPNRRTSGLSPSRCWSKPRADAKFHRRRVLRRRSPAGTAGTVWRAEALRRAAFPSARRSTRRVQLMARRRR